VFTKNISIAMEGDLVMCTPQVLMKYLFTCLLLLMSYVA